MNKLYSILLGTVPAEETWYFKQISAILFTQRMQEIRTILLTGVTREKLPMFAATVCALVRYSTYGTEILSLDSNNTYQDVTRPPVSEHNDPDYCFHDLVKPADTFNALRKYLDTDIEARLNAASWLELMGAGCLQLLREA